jgi:hypothetical protein
LLFPFNHCSLCLASCLSCSCCFVYCLLLLFIYIYILLFSASSYYYVCRPISCHVMLHYARHCTSTTSLGTFTSKYITYEAVFLLRARVRQHEADMLQGRAVQQGALLVQPAPVEDTPRPAAKPSRARSALQVFRDDFFELQRARGIREPWSAAMWPRLRGLFDALSPDEQGEYRRQAQLSRSVAHHERRVRVLGPQIAPQLGPEPAPCPPALAELAGIAPWLLPDARPLSVVSLAASGGKEVAPAPADLAAACAACIARPATRPLSEERLLDYMATLPAGTRAEPGVKS